MTRQRRLARHRVLEDEEGQQTKFYAEQEVARVLGVHRHTVKGWRESKLSPEPRRHGKRVLYTARQAGLLKKLMEALADRRKYRDLYSRDKVLRVSRQLFKDWWK